MYYPTDNMPNLSWPSCLYKLSSENGGRDGQKKSPLYKKTLLQAVEQF